MGSGTAFMLVEKKFKARNEIHLEFYILFQGHLRKVKRNSQSKKYNGYPYCLYACGDES